MNKLPLCLHEVCPKNANSSTTEDHLVLLGESLFYSSRLSRRELSEQLSVVCANEGSQLKEIECWFL